MILKRTVIWSVLLLFFGSSAPASVPGACLAARVPSAAGQTVAASPLGRGSWGEYAAGEPVPALGGYRLTQAAREYARPTSEGYCSHSGQRARPTETCKMHLQPRSGQLAPITPQGKWHSVRIQPPAGLPKIHWYDKLNPVWWFKNIDEPKAPAWYKPHDHNRTLKWRFRNPFHNFNAYVIGVADKKIVRSGRYPDQISNPLGGWNFAVSKYKWVRLPFISYQRGKFHFYIGWRDRGNFGAKINVK
jgi:hypothetical protein